MTKIASIATNSLALAVNGVFSVYKPKGWTSRKATDFVQLALSNELLSERNKHMKDPLPLKRKDRLKIGHGGTLDPMAEGVLVLGVGNGCKKLQEYLECTKEYIVTAKFGTATDTYDAEGKVVEIGNTKHITQQLIEKSLVDFRGNITQVPPIYSALKIQGKRLYEYARNGISLPEPIKPRTVVIKELELLQFEKETAIFRVICGGGTYMRSLVHDLAISMGTFAHMAALKRTRQGGFNEKDALILDATLNLKTVFTKCSYSSSVVTPKK